MAGIQSPLARRKKQSCLPISLVPEFLGEVGVFPKTRVDRTFCASVSRRALYLQENFMLLTFPYIIASIQLCQQTNRRKFRKSIRRFRSWVAGRRFAVPLVSTDRRSPHLFVCSRGNAEFLVFTLASGIHRRSQRLHRLQNTRSHPSGRVNILVCAVHQRPCVGFLPVRRELERGERFRPQHHHSPVFPTPGVFPAHESRQIFPSVRHIGAGRAQHAQHAQERMDSSSGAKPESVGTRSQWGSRSWQVSIDISKGPIETFLEGNGEFEGRGDTRGGAHMTEVEGGKGAPLSGEVSKHPGWRCHGGARMVGVMAGKVVVHQFHSTALFHSNVQPFLMRKGGSSASREVP